MSCVSWHVDNGPEPSRCVLVFRAVEDESNVQAEMDELASYVSSTRRQAQTAVGAGLMFDAEEPAVLRGSCYDNRPHCLHSAANPLAKLCIEGLVLWRVFLATRLALRRHPPGGVRGSGYRGGQMNRERRLEEADIDNRVERTFVTQA